MAIQLLEEAMPGWTANLRGGGHSRGGFVGVPDVGFRRAISRGKDRAGAIR
jgi:hypothetical protein